MLGLLAAGLAVFYRNKRKTNRELSLKNERLAFTLQKLQATQTQLIQSEKMASLGELTAGIAHEIQNPLNFVNNFSELNQELATELVEEADKGNTDLVKQIAADIKGNAEKINQHGKRADGIVKGMLQHSRSSSGQKELTDINALCDEYLRLAYHGWRAKDHSFNAKFETHFDASLDKINVIPQDLGRVILNLINNAFFAVNERNTRGEANYEPTVSVTTSLSPLPGRGVGGEVSISIRDNGTGIPAAVVEKIFQPFFTTKPTGQGTGLGLSLSYDIIKAHGGNIRVETAEGKGTEFIIELPVTN
ncbi:MAG: two-component sensor histidine kinase [Chitinophagaceae bacterium]|nr:two-component sensor histidine kinase [Chitinophagaceae bacterium]MBP8243742.1 two-component sensor histidine kinase [Chitinophagaceae bacterium]